MSELNGRRLAVLDHGYVRLVDWMGGDLSVVRAARVSYDAAWRAGEDAGGDSRLIRYLVANRHTTPLEAVEFQFEVVAPIFVVRQWHRHRTWSYNELSARYRELPEAFYVPLDQDVGVQSGTNKQGREIAPNPEAPRVTSLIKESCAASFRAYHELIGYGCPREVARAVLPVSTYTHMFAKVDLKNLLDFLVLRLHPHAQHEIRLYAEALLELARPVAPVCFAAWEETRRAHAETYPTSRLRAEIEDLRVERDRLRANYEVRGDGMEQLRAENRRLRAVVRAADAMRVHWLPYSLDDQKTEATYDEARAALDGQPRESGR